MATHKYIDRICLTAAVLSLVLTLLFMNGQALGVRAASGIMGYEAKLFDDSEVHTINIVMDDWDSFIESCENEEYAPCSVVIDNEAYKNVGIRAKGNTSLTTVSQMGSDRYSFKLEFDQYDSGKTYYGLDKLCLNNVIQDNTYMKDYLTYRMMGEFGVNAPLCSYVWITVNGEDWGLYLAVEGIEDAFLQRSYGKNHGELYKPDSMSFGGGRGNGRDFDMDEFMDRDGGMGPSSGVFPAGQERGGPPEGFSPAGPSEQDQDGGTPQEGFEPPEGFEGGGPGGMFGGMGSGDVKLQYTDDDPASYSNIFGSAKTDVSQADRTRLIQALKALGEGNVESALDIDQVLRYFVVHNFVVNGDSYTGSMVHNYYLYEEDGRLAMLPWDYNLAFGTFQGSDASEAVNDPIDSPLSIAGDGSRPMADWIFNDEAYTAQYHQYFDTFLNTVDPGAIIEETRALIAPYVERDPTKFCTYGQFEAGAEALKTFCALRMESVAGQLAGGIPSTGEGQAEDGSSLVSAVGLTLSDMGTMGNGAGPGKGGFQPGASGAAHGGENGAPAFGPMGGGDRPSLGGLSGESSVQAGSRLWALGGSTLVLLAGLLAAFKFSRRGRLGTHKPPAVLALQNRK